MKKRLENGIVRREKSRAIGSSQATLGIRKMVQVRKETETGMNEFYEAIENKIKASGYCRIISGREVYDDICDQIEGKENGTYLLISKHEDGVVFEYQITIYDENFNLGILTIRAPEGEFLIDFDAE